MSELRIPRRFCGPPDIVNGGYVCGSVASALTGPAEVTLRLPTPPEVPLALESTPSAARLHDGSGSLLAEAVALAELHLPLPEPVSFAAAQEASTRYVGFHHHPYPSCFVCGPSRTPEQGAGLGLFPGTVHGEARVVAAPFVVPTEFCDDQGHLRRELVWAALDCPSWFGHAAFARATTKILLGRLGAQIVRLPRRGERCVVHGFPLAQEGRRILCGSALAGEDGAWLAMARATWVELKAG